MNHVQNPDEAITATNMANTISNDPSTKISHVLIAIPPDSAYADVRDCSTPNAVRTDVRNCSSPRTPIKNAGSCQKLLTSNVTRTAPSCRVTSEDSERVRSTRFEVVEPIVSICGGHMKRRTTRSVTILEHVDRIQSYPSTVVVSRSVPRKTNGGRKDLRRRCVLRRRRRCGVSAGSVICSIDRHYVTTTEVIKPRGIEYETPRCSPIVNGYRLLGGYESRTTTRTMSDRNRLICRTPRIGPPESVVRIG